MTYGGTNWGHCGFTVSRPFGAEQALDESTQPRRLLYTRATIIGKAQSLGPGRYQTLIQASAPLRETRQQWNKLFQTKLVNMFSGSSPDLLKTTMVGNGTGFMTSSASIFSWVLKNPDSGATFTVVQQDKTPSTANVTFSATLDTSGGRVVVPNVSLYGRQSKILVTDYKFGSHTLLYASADVATSGVFDVDVLVLYLKEGQVGQFAFKGGKGLTFNVTGGVTLTSSDNPTHQAFTYTQNPGISAVKFSNGVLVYLLDQPTAWRFWAPKTTPNPQPRPDQQLFVTGPYLVRSAAVEGSVLRISGDSDVATALEVYAGAAAVEAVEWNGRRLPTTRTSYGAYRATVPGAEGRAVSLPSLPDLEWRAADSLPEAHPDFDDAGWTVCNKTTTRAPVAPTTLPVLFSSDYGFYAGDKLYRGYFDGTTATAVDISAAGGLGFGWTAWLNGRLLGGDNGAAGAASSSAVLRFPADAPLRSRGNVITVLVGYHGHDQASTARGVANPRGLLGARLLPAGTRTATGFTTWKIQGNAGGAAAGYALDPVRGPLHEGGLYAERMGWFLPGFAASSHPAFNRSSPLDAPAAGAGVRFYTATFALALDADLDVPLGVELAAAAGTAARVQLWINGWQYGKYAPHLGPQTRFPLPPGVINNRGNNTICLTVWAPTARGARLDGLRLFAYGAYASTFGFARDWTASQPGWKDRSAYA